VRFLAATANGGRRPAGGAWGARRPAAWYSAGMNLLPTTMVGSYPRPAWFTHQLAGKDILEAFKLAAHTEAFHDATRVVEFQ